MDAQVINKFITATATVLTDYFSIALEPAGAPTKMEGANSLDPVAVLLGITGDLEGQFMLGYQQETALNIARAMMGNPEYPEMDEMSRSALSELGNMIGGMTSTGLSEMGLFCNLSPPSVVSSAGGTINLSSSAMICLPFSSSSGDFRICIGLTEATM